MNQHIKIQNYIIIFVFIATSLLPTNLDISAAPDAEFKQLETVSNAPEAVLWDNGSFINSPGTGAGGG